MVCSEQSTCCVAVSARHWYSVQRGMQGTASCSLSDFHSLKSLSGTDVLLHTCSMLVTCQYSENNVVAVSTSMQVLQTCIIFIVHVGILHIIVYVCVVEILSMIG